jgi:hypothetical protein
VETGEERTLAPGSHGSSRNEGRRSETEVPGEVGPHVPAERAAEAPDPSETRASGGNPDTAEGADPDHPAVAAELVWAGRSGVVPGTGGLTAAPEALRWRDQGAAGVREDGAGPVGEEVERSAAPAGEDGPELAGQLADLLAGVLPFDPAALARGAEQFFAHLQGLGRDPTAASLARSLAPWLATGALAAATVELARRQRDRALPREPGVTAG